MRFCVEVEANCKAILVDNGYTRADDRDWTMNDYKKVGPTHKLHEYEVRLPLWHGTKGTRKPFAPWGAQNTALAWYQNYNEAKHDRHNYFHLANFDSLIDSACGLVALLSAQCYTYDFEPDVIGGGLGNPTDGFEIAIGGKFHVKFPAWPPAQQYGFNWSQLENV